MELSETYNLKVLFPGIAEEWHIIKNGNLTPDKVTPGSGKKVWWMCEKNHEWRTAVKNRCKVDGTGCPYCLAKSPRKRRNLLSANLELTEQWHPTKNGDLTPDKVTSGSKKKVWWQCEKGHEWRAVIKSRSKGNRTKCPYCTGKKASKEYNLLVVYPEIARQWHPIKNGDLIPDKVMPKSPKKVWWQCEKGHEWRAKISSRTVGTNNCPYCAGKKASKEYNLLVVYPELAKQWHPKKNGNLTPDKVTPGVNKVVWWKCEKKHEWRTSIGARRRRGSACPYCCGSLASKQYNLLVVYPEIVKQWHPTKNGTLTPDKVTPKSGKRVWWQCENGHEWEATVASRTSKMSGCPYCLGKKASKEYNLLVVYPEIAKQWHPIKNGTLTPDKVTPKSGKRVWWQCENGHEWEGPIYKLSKSKGCPLCYIFKK